MGRGDKPSPQGIRIPDENGKESPLRKYDRKTIVLTLPGVRKSPYYIIASTVKIVASTPRTTPVFLDFRQNQLSCLFKYILVINKDHKTIFLKLGSSGSGRNPSFERMRRISRNIFLKTPGDLSTTTHTRRFVCSVMSDGTCCV